MQGFVLKYNSIRQRIFFRSASLLYHKKGPLCVLEGFFSLRQVWPPSSRHKAGRQKESKTEMYAGGLMGCKGNAYTGEGALKEEKAYRFHQWQATQFREASADFLYAAIMPTLPEAAGMARAMAETGLPYLVSFTIQKDGKLIDGTSIHDAIAYIDGAAPVKPVCYMTNCVHPSIAYQALSKPFNQTGLVRERFLGIQANTSPLSYAELDGSRDLKCSDPEPFAEDMLSLRRVSNVKIFGGCCGTDGQHMEAVGKRLCF